jgi:hypothetical protein
MKNLFEVEPLRNYQAHATKWQVLKYKIRKFFIRLYQVMLALGLLFVIFQILRYSFPIYKIQEKEVVLDNLTVRVDQLKGEIVEDIKNCESKGYKESDGLIVFDSNNKASIGTFQFQKDTIRYYYKKLYGREISGKEAIIIALDDTLARNLTKDILFSSENASDNWLNCSKKLDIENRLKLIKKLQ